MATALSRLTRRRFGQLALGAGATTILPRAAFAEVATETPLHGLSAFGELKYGPDFTHFDYASPEAPQGGQMNLAVSNWTLNQSPSTFDTLNTFVLQGNAPPRMESLYDALMVASLDEPDAIYCALAESVTVSKDRNAFTFKLRPEARFSTGEPVTADDVVFTYETFKEKGHPSLQLALQEFDEAVAEDPETVRIVFSGRQSLQDAISAIGYPIIPKAFFTETPFERAGEAEIPGSGRFTIGRHERGRFIEYRKRDDYWAKDLPFAKGFDHFDAIRVDFFRDRQGAFEAFKKGAVTFREEFTSKSWATEYNFPAIASGQVIKREFPAEKRPKFQCWALNQRRERFADPLVRRAINMCFDFEWTNANMFYGLYEHSDSYFEGSDFKAEGLPTKAELVLLEPLRGKIPDAAFEIPWAQPTSDGSGSDRTLLRHASELFARAGWTRQGGRIVNRAGDTFTLEYLIDDPGFERVYGKFVQTLKLVGIDASIRLVDAAQYQDRQNSFEFDMIGAAFSLGATPTRDSLVGLFGSSSRDRPGSNNYVGMADPAVDSLIDRAANASSRAEMTVAMRSLDRVLRARLDWLPNINSSAHRAAFWNIFGFKDTKPDYGWPVESLWWFDKEKARAIGRA